MKIENIIWDTEDNGETIPQEELGLPSSLEITEDLDIDNVADYLSDTYGYCVKSFTV